MSDNFKEVSKKSGKDDPITIVSGLPRSGTSLMMQMLEAGGMPLMTDNIRKADEDNPQGYYEFENVKKIKEDASWLEDCHGKAVKMVSMLLYHLPQHYQCNVIFMKRELAEMLASQKLMIERQGQERGQESDQEIAENFEKHLHRMENWLAEQPHMQVLYLKYNDIISDPIHYAQAVNRFLGGGLEEEQMARVVDNSLYRKRVQSPVEVEEGYSEDGEEQIRQRLEDLNYL
jgi:hypothetical protein